MVCCIKALKVLGISLVSTPYTESEIYYTAPLRYKLSHASEKPLAKIVDLQGAWAAAIGKAFVAFGSIEHVTTACLREIPRDCIQRSTKFFRLGQRIDLLVELLEVHDGEEFKQLSAALIRVKYLAKTRNLIAHNPLVLEIYEWRDGSLLHQEVIASMSSDARITLKELTSFANDAEALSSSLYTLSSAVFKVLAPKADA